MKASNAIWATGKNISNDPYSPQHYQDLGYHYPPCPQHLPPSLMLGPAATWLRRLYPQPAHLRLKLVFQGLLGGPQVPAPQTGIQPPNPDLLAFDSDALGSVRGTWQVPGQERHQEEIGNETLSFGPKEHHLPNHLQLIDGETEVERKYQD